MNKTDLKYLIVSVLILTVFLASFIFSAVFIARQLSLAFQEPKSSFIEVKFDLTTLEKIKPILDNPQL